MSKTKSITVQMDEILKEFKNNTDAAIEEESNEIGKKTSADLRSKSPKETGDYASGWRVKKLGKNGVIVYNSKMPGLTHLLENGHMIVNKRGEFGRYNGKPHIAPIAEERVAEYIKNLTPKE